MPCLRSPAALPSSHRSRARPASPPCASATAWRRRRRSSPPHASKSTARGTPSASTSTASRWRSSTRSACRKALSRRDEGLSPQSATLFFIRHGRQPHEFVAIAAHGFPVALDRSHLFERDKGPVHFRPARADQVCDLGLIEIEQKYGSCRRLAPMRSARRRKQESRQPGLETV